MSFEASDHTSYHDIKASTVISGLDMDFSSQIDFSPLKALVLDSCSHTLPHVHVCSFLGP